MVYFCKRSPRELQMIMCKYQKINTTNMSNNELNMYNTDTYREIFQQPLVWKKEYDLLLQHKEAIGKFVSKHFGSDSFEIILSGAGTSAYIGDILSILYAQKGYTNCKSISTTDIITHPKAFLPVDKKVVLISFARSGNSPESIATVKLANKICKEVVHIIITCNKDGVLASGISSEDLLLLLPPETNDKSLAMTSSFSTMLLAGLLLIDINNIEQKRASIDELCKSARNILDQYFSKIEEISKRSFTRAIFLGSGELKGIAQECHLKLQEMTDGKVICKYDSFLGFRHGPKAAINEETLLIYLLSDDEYVSTYEKDLVKQINTNNKVVGQIVVSPKNVDISSVKFDLEIIICEHNEYSFILDVLVGQLLAFFKSLDLKFNPDSPSVSGNIARIVEGVEIYDYKK